MAAFEEFSALHHPDQLALGGVPTQEQAIIGRLQAALATVSQSHSSPARGTEKGK
jgi:hypothetical protein